ncbi:hypothetical protein P7C70_g1685, partial [Phenoliferia sp. Uapishka_3]
MPTELLDLPDDILDIICEATATGKDTGTRVQFDRRIDHLFNLAQTNRWLRRLAEQPLWKWVELWSGVEAHFGSWRIRKLSESPHLWTRVTGMSLAIGTTKADVQFAALALSLSVNLVYLCFEVRDPPPLPPHFHFDFCLSERLRRLPLRMISLGWGLAVSFADDTFRLLDDIPTIRHAELRGRTLIPQLEMARRDVLTRIEYFGDGWTALDALAKGVHLSKIVVVVEHLDPGLSEFLWTSGNLDKLEGLWTAVSLDIACTFEPASISHLWLFADYYEEQPLRHQKINHSTCAFLRREPGEHPSRLSTLGNVAAKRIEPL